MEHFCINCKYWEQTYTCLLHGEPEGVCNLHTAIDVVYGHQGCDEFMPSVQPCGN